MKTKIISVIAIIAFFISLLFLYIYPPKFDVKCPDVSAIKNYGDHVSMSNMIASVNSNCTPLLNYNQNIKFGISLFSTMFSMSLLASLISIAFLKKQK